MTPADGDILKTLNNDLALVRTFNVTGSQVDLDGLLVGIIDKVERALKESYDRGFQAGHNQAIRDRELDLEEDEYK